VTAAVQTAPARITLNWTQASVVPGGYAVYRRPFGSDGATWNAAVANLPGGTLTYVDTNVVVGTIYEYQILRQGFTNSLNSPAECSGYITAGIEIPEEEQRGKLILCVVDYVAAALSNDLVRLERDLAGDGWQVVRLVTGAKESWEAGWFNSVTNLKEGIRAIYNADPANVKALLLFGHVPVPLSGTICPDGHSDTQGAMPADVYYGDMLGVWTDTTVNRPTPPGYRPNVPGDGRFDQELPPTNVVLQVGRVDLSSLTAFSVAETNLLRRYLAKNHAYRNALIRLPRRGLVHDEYGEWNGEAFGATGWRGIGTLCGPGQTTAQNWHSTLTNSAYLFACGIINPGWTPTASHFAAHPYLSVFTSVFGSYKVDWYRENCETRAPLANDGYILTCGWQGRPHWFFHHMGLGKTIGYSTMRSQNAQPNEYLWGQFGVFSSRVHVALHGDPSLRMDMIVPPGPVLAATNGSSVNLSWGASPDNGILGYHVYRAGALAGPYARLDAALVTATQFTDPEPRTSDVYYMVRAVRLESGLSGSYSNLSQGAFTRVRLDGSANRLPVADSGTVPTLEDVPIPITVTASDPDGDALLFSRVVPPARGRLTGVWPNLVYTPFTNWFGTDQFTFVADDGICGSQVATVTVTVAAVNDPPIAYSRVAVTSTNQPVVITIASSDVEGSNVVFSKVADPFNGSVAGSSSDWTYTPAPEFRGVDEFVVKCNDGQTDSAPATVTVTVEPPVSRPVYWWRADGLRSFTNGQSVGRWLDCMSGVAAAQATAANLPVLVTNAVAGRPGLRFDGADDVLSADTPGFWNTNFSFLVVFQTTAASGAVCSAVSPTAANGHTDRSIGLWNGRLANYNSVGAETTLANPGVANVTNGQPHMGLVTVDGTGTRLYVDGAYAGLGSNTIAGSWFTGVNIGYQYLFGWFKGDVAEIRCYNKVFSDAQRTQLEDELLTRYGISRGTPISPPVSGNQSLVVSEDTPADITLAASDPNGDPLTFAIVSGPAHGSLSGSSSNRLYTPATNYYGPDSFTWKANDGGLDSLVATVSVTVVSVNDAPVAEAQSIATRTNTPRTFVMSGSDIEGDPLSFPIAGQPAHGTAAVSVASVTYTPAPGYAGPDSFPVCANDGQTSGAPVTITVLVDPDGGHAPALLSGPFVAEVAGPNQTVPATVSASDADGERLTFTWRRASGPGAVTFSPNAAMNASKTTVRFSASGLYRVEVEVFDGVLAATGTVEVAVPGTEGAVVGWGNNNGQLGLGDKAFRFAPARMRGVSNIVAATAGNAHSLILQADGTLWASGSNSEGQLGDGTTTERLVPIPVPGMTSVVAIAARYQSSFALKSDGTVWAWGYNYGGVLGDGTTTRRTSPVPVVGMSNVVAIGCGQNHGLAAKADGTAWAWGLNTYGQLGDNTTSNRLTPVQVIGVTGAVALAAGENHSLALTSNRMVYAWGVGSQGQVGDGTTQTRKTAVPIMGGMRRIAAGQYGSMAIATNGQLWTWGYNYYGQLGIGSTIQSTNRPACVLSLTNVTSIVAGQYHCAARTADNGVWTWGYNGSGQLGNGTLVNTNAPIRPYALSNTIASAGCGDTSTFAIDMGGSGNRPPSANALNFSPMEDNWAWDVMVGADADGDPLSYVVLSAPSNGILLNYNGRWNYQPNPEWSGTDVFSYKVNDGQCDSPVATVRLDVWAYDDYPAGTSQDVTTPMNVAKSILLAGTDAEGSNLTFSIAQSPSHGTVTGAPPAVLYTPAAGYAGFDSFQFNVYDGTHANCYYPGTVTILVTAPIVDRDGDGMADDWEIASFGSTNAANGGAAQDWDEDGAPNLDEFVARTCPTNTADVLALGNPSWPGDTNYFMFSWPTKTGRYYSVEYTRALAGSVWSNVTVGYRNVPGDGGAMVYTNRYITGTNLFFRARVIGP
jgi:alpha-tubulin suppressor-like RCC1 family protein